MKIKDLKPEIYQRGFTFIELLIVMVIAASMIGLMTINLLGARSKAALATTVDPFIADLRQTQIKSMVGDTEGRTTADNYGIYFEATRYILFHGSSYSSTSPDNFVINLDDGLQFTSVSFPSQQIVFAKGTGEVMGFVPGSNEIVIRNSRNNQDKTLIINRYGVITNVN